MRYILEIDSLENFEKAYDWITTNGQLIKFLRHFGQFVAIVEKTNLPSFFISCEEDIVVPQAFSPNDNYNSQYQYTQINQFEAWDKSFGSNVVVGVLDSGIQPDHPDLQQNIVPGYNVVLDSSVTTPYTSHGTLVAGRVAAVINNTIGVAGVAPYAKVMPIVVAVDSYAALSDVIEGICYGADAGCKVLNLSYQYGNILDRISPALTYAESKSTCVFVASGNGGDESVVAHNNNVMTVGGSTATGTYGSYGAGLDILAPASVQTTNTGSGYGFVSGTSLSAPAVAGVAALLLSVRPELKPRDVYYILRNTANSTFFAGWTEGWSKYKGYGIVDANAAVNAAISHALLEPPGVIVTSILDGSTLPRDSQVTVSLATASAYPLVAMRIYVDDVLYYNGAVVTSYAVNSGTIGQHTLRVEVVDSSGEVGKATVLFHSIGQKESPSNIAQLAAAARGSYRVRIRGKNAQGVSEWSGWSVVNNIPGDLATPKYTLINVDNFTTKLLCVPAVNSALQYSINNAQFQTSASGLISTTRDISAGSIRVKSVASGVDSSVSEVVIEKADAIFNMQSVAYSIGTADPLLAATSVIASSSATGVIAQVGILTATSCIATSSSSVATVLQSGSLSPTSATQSTISQSGAITQAHVAVAVASFQTVLTIAGIVTQQHNTIGVTSSEAGLSSVTPITQQHNTIGATSSEAALSSTSAVTQQHNTIGVTSSEAALSSAGIVTQQHNTLGTTNSEAALSSVTPITQQHNIGGVSSTQNETAGTGFISQANVFAGTSCFQAVTASTSAVTQTHVAVGAGSSEAASSGIGAVTSSAIYVATATSQAATTSAASISQVHVSIFAASSQSANSAVGAVAQTGALVGTNASQANSSGAGVVSVTLVLVAAESSQSSLIATAPATQVHIVVANNSAIAALSEASIITQLLTLLGVDCYGTSTMTTGLVNSSYRQREPVVFQSRLMKVKMSNSSISKSVTLH